MVAAGVVGCAGASTTAQSVSGSTLKIYAGGSQGGSGGPAAQDLLDAERLALQQQGSQVGRFKIVLEPLAGGKITDHARTAISDSSTIAYLGELGPHSSADSLGITNGAGVLEISPSDTAIELTQPTKAVPNSPTRYYESLKTYGRTFGRVVPAANHEATAQVEAMIKLGVKRLYVAGDGGPYGRAVALAVTEAATGKGLAASTGTADPAKVQASGADALFLGASDQAAATRLLDAVTVTSPAIKLFVPAGLYDASFAAGLTAGAQRNLELSAPGFIVSGPNANLPPAGRKFLSDFRAAYGRDPQQSAIFGYEAMSLVLDTLRRAGASANSRSSVVTEFLRTKNRVSVLGSYSINGNGDTTLAPYVLSHFKAGRLVPFESLQG